MHAWCMCIRVLPAYRGVVICVGRACTAVVHVICMRGAYVYMRAGCV